MIHDLGQDVPSDNSVQPYEMPQKDNVDDFSLFLKYCHQTILHRDRRRQSGPVINQYYTLVLPFMPEFRYLVRNHIGGSQAIGSEYPENNVCSAALDVILLDLRDDYENAGFILAEQKREWAALLLRWSLLDLEIFLQAVTKMTRLIKHLSYLLDMV